MSATTTISVCIVSGRRSRQLAACLSSLAAQRDAPLFEVLVCSTGDDDVAREVTSQFPNARVALAARGSLPGAARNVLIEQATGDLLLFLDDDVVVEPHLLRNLAELARQHLDVAVFGGPNETPPRSSRFQVVQGAVLASVAGSGPVRRRYGAHPAGAADERWFTLCNLAVRRDLMRPFADDLRCAEENEMLNALHATKVSMRYDPSLVVYHERRATLGAFARQMWKYGRGRGQLMRRAPETLRLLHLVPVALVLYLVAVPLLASVDRRALLAAIAYAGVVFVGAARVATTLRRASAVPTAALLIVVLHCCYGVGILRGLLPHQQPPRPRPRWLPTDETLSSSTETVN